MTPDQNPGAQTAEPVPSPGRLWAGGVATAIVAALVVVAGVFIARRILGIPVLAPRTAGDLGTSVTAVYAVVAAACALLAALSAFRCSGPRREHGHRRWSLRSEDCGGSDHSAGTRSAAVRQSGMSRAASPAR